MSGNKIMNEKMKAIQLAVAIEGVEIYDGWQQDGQTFGNNTQKQIVGATYGIAGGVAGAAIGAKIGFAIGTLFGGLGAIPGTIIGGAIGGYFGGDYSEKGAEYIYDELQSR